MTNQEIRAKTPETVEKTTDITRQCKKEALELFLKCLEKHPQAIQPGIGSAQFAKELITGADALLDYLYPVNA
jgi:hypothetical protein